MYAFVVIESIKVIVLQIVVRWLNVEITNIAKKRDHYGYIIVIMVCV